MIRDGKDRRVVRLVGWWAEIGIDDILGQMLSDTRGFFYLKLKINMIL